MKGPRNLSITGFTYHLPEEKIASYPLAERDASRLLIYKEKKISTATYRQLASYIPEDSVLVFNNTKVVEARLLFQKATGGTIEIFCLEPHEQYPDITTAMLQQNKVLWLCLVGGASKWKPGQVLEKKVSAGNSELTLSARYVEKRTGCFAVELSWTPADISFAEILHAMGAIPLPPYIKRQAEDTDRNRYQTIYARSEGSVAAPTAGLHFTDSVFKSLASKHIVTEYVTLHVGAGTFKPVKSETMEEHDMHAEWIDVSRKLIECLLNESEESIIAVGTTSLRTLESLYWLGVKIHLAASGNQSETFNTDEPLQLSQWEPYSLAEHEIPLHTALRALLDRMARQQTDRLTAKTQILIAPGYTFKVISGLITNFHQPQSTLLLLVAALIGDDWRNVYQYALENGFRFLSYGDGCLLWKK